MTRRLLIFAFILFWVFLTLGKVQIVLFNTGHDIDPTDLFCVWMLKTLGVGEVCGGHVAVLLSLALAAAATFLWEYVASTRSAAAAFGCLIAFMAFTRVAYFVRITMLWQVPEAISAPVRPFVHANGIDAAFFGLAIVLAVASRRAEVVKWMGIPDPRPTGKDPRSPIGI